MHKVLGQAVRVLLPLLALPFLYVAAVLGPHVYNGLFHGDEMDARDLARWEYGEGGVIRGAEGFELPGNRDTCWLLIHGYTSTPREMRELGERLNRDLGDYVVAPRLEGHGEVPSHLAGLCLDDWYRQVEGDLRRLSTECARVNVAGSSFGGVLALRLAEERRLGLVCLIAPFFGHARGGGCRGLPLRGCIEVLGGVVGYVEKDSPGSINMEAGRKLHIGYLNMPFGPIRRSYPFIDQVVADVSRVDEPVLVVHSANDEVADPRAAREVFRRLRCKDKEFKLVKRSNHVLLMDYDKDEVIEDVLEFARRHRTP